MTFTRNRPNVDPDNAITVRSFPADMPVQSIPDYTDEIAEYWNTREVQAIMHQRHGVCG